MLMVMSLVLIYIMPLVLYDRLKIPILSVKCYSWISVIVLFLIVFNFDIISNIAYFNMIIRYEKNYALTNRILDRIE